MGRLIDRHRLRRVFLPLALALLPCLLLLAFADGVVVLPLAAVVAASVFGQVTVNETMTARYVAPALRAKLYSVRFTVGFLGAAAASPLDPAARFDEAVLMERLPYRVPDASGALSPTRHP